MFIVVKFYKYSSPSVAEVFEDEKLANGYAEIMNKKEHTDAYRVFKPCN
jgi:hypothetical protein